MRKSKQSLCDGEQPEKLKFRMSLRKHNKKSIRLHEKNHYHYCCHYSCLKGAVIMMVIMMIFMPISTILVSASSIPEVSMGTTILAVKFKGGVIVAADTRTSVSGYVSNRYARKIVPFSRFGVLCRSGSAADTQALADIVKWELSQRLGGGGVSQAARLLRTLIVKRNNMDSAGLICCGVISSSQHRNDDDDNDSSTVQGEIYTVLPGGTMMEESEYAVGGSGSTYILGWLDDALTTCNLENSAKPQEQLLKFSQRSKQDMIHLCGRAVQLAMDRDGSSGGFVRLFVIDENGIEEVLNSPRIVQPSYSNKGEEIHGDRKTNGSCSSANSRGVNLPGFAVCHRQNTKL